MGRVDYRTAVPFTLASLPGAILGVFLVHQLPRGLFDPLFGLLLLALCLVGLRLVVRVFS